MTYTLGQAAKATGKTKSTIQVAIKSGRISASRDDLGRYQIDPAELHRVYPLEAERTDEANAARPATDPEIQAQFARLDEQIAFLRSQLEAKDRHIDALTLRLAAPKPDDQHAALLEKLTSLAGELALKQTEAGGAKTPPTPEPNRGIFGWFRKRAA